jgi:hypothetical protein
VAPPAHLPSLCVPRSLNNTGEDTADFAERADFIAIPAVFYFVVLAAGLDLRTLRRAGWIFDSGPSGEAWYRFYTLYGSSATHPTHVRAGVC